MVVIAGKNDIAVHGLMLALQYFDADNIIVVPNKNDIGINTWQQSLVKKATEKGVSIKSLVEVYEIEIEFFLSLEFDQIIIPEKLKTDRVYNVHFSKLPAYKGMHTSVWPILFGDQESGVTLHKVDVGIDTGDIVRQKVFPIGVDDRSQDCYRKCIESSIELLSECFEEVMENNLYFYEQGYLFSTYFSKISIDYKDNCIDFNKTAWQIKRYVYAFSFRVYQLVMLNGRGVASVEILPEKSTFKPGTLLSEKENSVVYSTVDYNVEIYYDRLKELIDKIPTIDLEEISGFMLNILGVNDRNHKGWSPIIVAAYHGRKDIVSFLLDNGANINDRNYKGTTVLMYAKDYSLKKCDSGFIHWLLQLGADPTLKDWSENTIYDYVSNEQAKFLGLPC